MAGKRNEPWYFKYLRRELNKIWGWCPERKKAKKRALVRGGILEEYECEECGSAKLKRNQVEIDHLIPRESTDGWDGWDGYIERTFAPSELLQIVCKPCHYKKSAQENASRRKHNAARKTKV